MSRRRSSPKTRSVWGQSATMPAPEPWLVPSSAPTTPRTGRRTWNAERSVGGGRPGKTPALRALLWVVGWLCWHQGSILSFSHHGRRAGDNLGAASMCGVEAGEGICNPAPSGGTPEHSWLSLGVILALLGGFKESCGVMSSILLVFGRCDPPSRAQMNPATAPSNVRLVAPAGSAITWRSRWTSKPNPATTS